MVHQEARKKAARALERFLNCETTNEEFDSEYRAIAEDGSRQTDRAIPAIYGFAWNLYDDHSEHKLKGEFELEAPVRRMAERCLLFLRSDREYEWRKANFFGIDWRRVFSRFVPWIHWEEDLLTRFEQFLGEPAGDASVWPFYRREDYPGKSQG